MYAFWRKSNAFDPAIFAEGAVAVLAAYPLDVVDLITDPRTGLPGKLIHPPTAKEIKDACDVIMEERQRRQDRSLSLRAQFAEREAYEAELAARAKRPTKEQLEQKLGRPIVGDKPKPPLPAERLWERWIEQRQMGAKLAPEARAILEAAGYKIDGHDDQQPQGRSA